MNKHTKTAQHPAQEAIEAQIRQFEGEYKVTACFAMDEASMKLFRRENKIVVAFICTLRDENEACLMQGRGLSFISYDGARYVQKAILYARNASLIDCVMRASRLSTIFPSDEYEDGVSASGESREAIVVNKPSEKQVNYLKSLMEVLPSTEQNDLLTQLPQMSRYDVSQLINNLKTA